MKFTKQLREVTKKLVAVAQGRKSADLVIINGKLINVNTAEIQENIDVAISEGRIALVGDAHHCIGEDTKIIDASGQFLCPGFIDGHIHVESSMMSVREYAKTVIPHGTTSIYMDPHEIGNVLGMDGIKLMIEDGRDVPLRVNTVMPSCVPACPGFEDTGAILSAKDVEDAMLLDDISGLGEMMNFPGVLSGDDEVHRKIQSTLENNKTVTGHYSMPETAEGLNAYIASGVSCCHESVRKEDALAKIRLGMYAQLREGSAWHDVKETIRCVTEHNIDTRFVTLVSDDRHANTLIEYGHMDHIVKRAIEEGVNPINAIQMATINVAECFNVSRDLGSISPGKLADIVILDDLARVKVDKVLINGELLSDNGNLIIDIPNKSYPDFAKSTMNLPKDLTPDDFEIDSPDASMSIIATRVMEVIEAKVGIIAKKLLLPIKEGKVCCDLSQDIVKAVVVERHSGSGTMGKGFVRGFHLKSGAVASTVSHDAHNLLIVGTNDSDMALAGNTLAEVGGGMVVVKDGKILALLPLPIAGLMSEECAEKVAELVEKLDEAWKELGCDLVSPFMTMALIALAVLPELRLTNRGLVDTVNFKIVDLFV
nr:adenine deaminase [Clostridium cadaveris]